MLTLWQKWVLKESLAEPIVPQHHVRQLVKPGLKVVHTDTRKKYTVDSVEPEEIVLASPEGQPVVVNVQDFAKNYVVD
jgi:hypothetical protein